MPSPVDFRDVQGLVRFGHKQLKAARYLVLAVRNAPAARAWLSVAPVTTAEILPSPPSHALHIALTAAGLAALGVPAAVRAAFSPEFLGGMSDQHRARRLGDLGTNAPAHWRWGGSAGLPHVLVMCFTRDFGDLDAFVARTMGRAVDDAFVVQQVLDTCDQDGIEPFGFADGLSQPAIDWDEEVHPDARKLDYSNVAALGEFLLGYRNEYDKFTDRPVVAADASSAALPGALDDPGKKDVGRNGTYLVLRQLDQDVRAFWQFLHRCTGGDQSEMDRLSSAFVGRTRDGEPLVASRQLVDGSGSRRDQGRLNQFTFDDDPRGVTCPFGAHIRRSNPRNTDFPGRPAGLGKILAALGASSKGFRDDLISPVRFHRILRRGREYGPELPPGDALEPAPPGGEPERGLNFVCLNANIGRQFEFLQNAWLMNTTFADLRGETDPLVGLRHPVPGCPATAEFSLPREGRPAERVTGLPQFVTVKGGEYFFLPGVSSLRYLSSVSG